LVGDNGEDWLRGGAGDDRIEAADGDWDQVIGGPGVDRASVDEKELQHPGSVQNVEYVNGRRR
jgi:hypothetical protein